jgi:hypothetical protein
MLCLPEENPKPIDCSLMKLKRYFEIGKDIERSSHSLRIEINELK